MITFGWLIEQLQDALTDTTDVTKAKIKRAANLAWFQCCASRDWKFLERKISLDITGLAEDAPIVLPANLVKVIGAIVDGDDDRYVFSPTRDRRGMKHLCNWFYADPVTTVLASGSTLVGTENATALTSTAEFPATDCAGEFIRIGDNMGLYEIDTWTSTSAMTLVDGYRGETFSQDTYFEVRPRNTKRINFCDQYGNFKAPSAPELTYTIQPLPLYNTWDAIDLPNYGLTVFFKAFKSIARQHGWTRVSAALEDEYIEEYGAAQRQEPRNAENMKPLSRFKMHSRSIRWGIYT